MTDLVNLLDLADLALVRCEVTVPSETRLELARVVRRARRKLGYVGEALVVAFAGGTGSGKSSLINALVGEGVAPVGVVRPTTDEALAAIPLSGATHYSRLLTDLDVTSRVEVSALSSTILVDLPDFDSTALKHRHIVETVLPVVDAVVWVFDPEKYADRIVHDEFLSEMSAYESQFVFVLNQADRLGSDAVSVVGFLSGLLVADGFREPDVVSSVAREPDIDISELVTTLYARLDSKRTVISKLATDLRVAANDGWVSVRAALAEEPDTSLHDEYGLSAATFVSLGVASFEVLSGIEES
jgi:50S ribosomal subunit-associated GTPase HflX